MSKIKIVLAGPRGKMGQEAIKMIETTEQFQLVAVIDRKRDDASTEDASYNGATIYFDADTCFTEIKPDVFIDLTMPEVGFLHTKLALEHSVRSVVGTSGFSEAQIEELRTIAAKNKTGCIIAPNFALGAVLMMAFSKVAATYFQDVEIIEQHHDQKIDAPSGTAVKTIELIQENRQAKQQGHPEEYETIAGARGGDVDGIKVHSVRLPGLVAHQEVMFGGKGELFTIRHDSIHRESFMGGLKLAVEKVMETNELIYGLEHVMGLDFV